MTEDWRKIWDKKQVVGVVFIDFKKAFDSVSHALLLHDRKIVTIVQGAKSSCRDDRYGVPQGSVLGRILFSLFCNDLPDIIQDEEVDIEMFADDTTICAICLSF